jgi:hypothetical protein
MAAIVAPSGAFEAETITLLDALTGTYSNAREEAIDTFIRALKLGATSGTNIFATRDVLCIAGLDQADSLIWWNDPSSTCTAVNSPVFTADRGFLADSLNSRYINTNFVPSTPGSNYSQNSASIGTYSRTDSQGSAMDIGAQTSSPATSALILGRGTTGNAVYRLNSTASGVLANSSSIGALTASRTASDASALYKNETSLGTSSVVSTSVVNIPLFVGAQNVNGAPFNRSDRQYAAWHAGGGLTANEAADFYNALQAYLTTIGANV